MIDKERLLNDKDFYKSFKNGEDLTSFFKQMHKRAVEHMLYRTLVHLDNEKHQKSIQGNYRKGHGTKKIKTSYGEDEIKVPRDREGSFNPVLGLALFFFSVLMVLKVSISTLLIIGCGVGSGVICYVFVFKQDKYIKYFDRYEKWSKQEKRKYGWLTVGSILFVLLSFYLCLVL